MLRKIESLREEPKPIRNRYAFYWAFLLTFVIAGFWVISLPSKFAAINNIGSVVVEDDESGGFSRAFGEFKNNLTASVSNIKEVTSSTTKALEESQALLEAEKENDNEIDIDAMFATSSVAEPAPTAPAPKEIRIATTSQKQASSSIPKTE